jgi:hypothetical protein
MSNENVIDLTGLGMIQEQFDGLVKVLLSHKDIVDDEFILEVTDILNLALEGLAVRKLSGD